MNLKRTFGTILTVLGIAGLLFTGICVMNHSGQATALVVFGILGIIFFSTGISLIKGTKDEAN